MQVLMVIEFLQVLWKQVASKTYRDMYMFQVGCQGCTVTARLTRHGRIHTGEGSYEWPNCRKSIHKNLQQCMKQCPEISFSGLCYCTQDIQETFLFLFSLVKGTGTFPLLVFRNLILVNNKETRTFNLEFF